MPSYAVELSLYTGMRAGELAGLKWENVLIQKMYGSYDGYVFSTAEGNAHCKTISDCIRNKCIQIGIPTKGIHSVRRTVNSKMRCSGVSSTVAASLLGHTEEVNNANYTYDITNMDYKMEIVKKMNKIMKGNQGNHDSYNNKNR